MRERVPNDLKRKLGIIKKSKRTPKLDYHEYMVSEAWNRKKKKTFKEKGQACQKCGFKYSLVVHHATYENFGVEKISTDLFVLCKLCHAEYHRLLLGETTVKKTLEFIGLLAPKVKKYREPEYGDNFLDSFDVPYII